jgi:hypothetical protein
MANTLILLGFIVLLVLSSIFYGFMRGDFTDKKEKLLREIRDELKKKNKDDAKEGKVIE